MRQQFDLNLSISQQLRLTPSTILSLKVLQLPLHSLEEFLKNEIETNPLIEVEEDDSLEKSSEGSFDFLFEGGSFFYPEEEEEKQVPSKKSVREALKEQIVGEFDGIEREIALHILNNLDFRGFLLLSEEEISSEFGVPVETVRSVRERFKRLSPVGCGSYSLKELLKVQLEEMGAPKKLIDSLSHLEYISSPSTFIAKSGLSRSEFEELLSYLKRCDTRPGEGGEFNAAVKPDVKVRLNGKGELEVEVLSPGAFNIRINSYYLKYASREELKRFVQEKYQRALHLKKALDQRRETLEKVVRKVFEFQRDFLKDGKTLKPLTLSDIASSLSVHESTVSRALKDKFVETPFGVFPAKFFFGRGSASVTADAVKEAIREIVESEDKRKPLSDSKIAKLLEERGFKVARRTVAKYREELGIPGAFKRRVK